jgi:peroxiredoxin
LTVANGDATLIFNKNFEQWGAYDYKESEDVLRVPAKVGKAASSSERLTFAINKEGRVTLNWGTMEIAFNVQ